MSNALLGLRVVPDQQNNSPREMLSMDERRYNVCSTRRGLSDLRYFTPTFAGFKIGYFHAWSTAGESWEINTDLSLRTNYHVAVTYNRGATGNDPTFYFNGVAQTTNELITPSGSVTTGEDSIRFGAPANPTGAFFNGNEADWFFYNVILSANEIASLANGAGPWTIRFASSIGYYYPLRGTKSPEVEMSTKNVPATVTNATQGAAFPIKPYYMRRR